jgi:hypothetical protein
MPVIGNVSVTNIATNVNWVSNQDGSGAPSMPLPVNYNVYVNAAANGQPPVGFLNNPAHQYVVRGRYVADGSAFVSGLMTVNAGLSDIPHVYVFSA